jgi:LysR family nitrogen assimilation transcriptional regulator
MDAWHLRNFLKIVECGSISLAAEQLGLAQPSLSHQLRRLEDEIGIKLFRRTARGVILSEPGRVFREHAILILNAMQRAREEVNRKDEEVQGAVQVALPGSTSNFLGVPLLMACREHFPKVSLRIHEVFGGSIMRSLEAGRIDLAVLFYAENLPHLSAQWVANETLLLIGPGGTFGEVDEHGVAVEEVAPEILNEHGLVLPTRSLGLDRLRERYAESLNLKLTVHIEIDSMAHIRTLVREGVGYSLLAHSAVREDLTSGKLSAARIAGVNLSRSVSLVRHPIAPVTKASVEVGDLALKLLHRAIVDGTWLADSRPDLRP